MKLLIVGSRSIIEFDLTPYITPETDTIISGGANGIDTLAERYADEHRMSKIILRPQYDRYKRAAPLRAPLKIPHAENRRNLFRDILQNPFA